MNCHWPEKKLTKVLLDLSTALTLGRGSSSEEPTPPSQGHHSGNISRLVTEEAMINSPWVGLKIYIRNKHLRRLRHFAPGRALVFVHGATYPASPSFDLELEVDRPGWITWRGFDVYMLDLPAMADDAIVAIDTPDAAEPMESTANSSTMPPPSIGC